MRGLLLALAAYLLWGCFPLFFSLLGSVPAFEILAHRIVWAWVFTLSVIVFTARTRAWFGVLKSPNTLAWLLLSSVLVGINWLVFIYAVSSHQVIEASLGYFITPLVSLLLGHLLLREAINWQQVLAALIAASAVAFELFSLGQLPWVTLVLSCSFAFYGLVRKHKPVDSLIGLNIESLIMGVPSLIYLFWLSAMGAPQFGQSTSVSLLLIASGVVTAIPLLLFAAATARLNLSVVGFIMYINPTMQFLSAVFILGETYPPQRLITFTLIWLAMALFMWGLWRANKKPQPKDVPSS